jgi:predicted lipoprotein with Yx(FWY)xxD motif
MVMIGNELQRAAPRRALGGLALAGLLALGVVAVSPLAALAQDEEQVVVSTASGGDLGTYLVGPDGRTLYYFLNDVTPAVSTCTGDCLTNWPPLLVEEGYTLAAGDGVTGTLASATQADGSVLATYRGRPLYYFAGDTEAGQTNGQGKGDVWYVASDDGSVPSSAAAPTDATLTLATATTDLGTFLTGKDGLTIYYFAADTTPGVSVCEGDCLAAWPPVSVEAGSTVAAGDGVSGVIGLITGTDGSTQVTYDGRPLYYWQGDTEAGQTTGQGVNDIWWVAEVSGNLPAAQ